MAITIDASDIVKIVSAFGSLGGGFAFVSKIADRLFSFWLERLRARAAIADAKEQALERIAVSNERMVGVLETMADRLDRTDGRLEQLVRRADRLEAHLDMPVAPSATPPEEPPAPVERPRNRLTDPGLNRGAPGAPPPSPPSRPGALHE